MFHTVSYRGHYIHLAYLDRKEKIDAQLMHKDGGFHLIRCKSFIGAKRIITKHKNRDAEALAEGPPRGIMR